MCPRAMLLPYPVRYWFYLQLLGIDGCIFRDENLLPHLPSHMRESPTLVQLHDIQLPKLCQKVVAARRILAHVTFALRPIYEQALHSRLPQQQEGRARSCMRVPPKGA